MNESSILPHHDLLKAEDIDPITAQAIVYAYDCSPSVCAFEALAFGRWWKLYGQHERRGMDGALGGVFNGFDQRWWDLRRQEGRRAEDGTALRPSTAFRLVEHARAVLARNAGAAVTESAPNG